MMAGKNEQFRRPQIGFDVGNSSDPGNPLGDSTSRRDLFESSSIRAFANDEQAQVGKFVIQRWQRFDQIGDSLSFVQSAGKDNRRTIGQVQSLPPGGCLRRLPWWFGNRNAVGYRPNSRVDEFRVQKFHANRFAGRDYSVCSSAPLANPTAEYRGFLPADVAGRSGALSSQDDRNSSTRSFGQCRKCRMFQHRHIDDIELLFMLADPIGNVADVLGGAQPTQAPIGKPNLRVGRRFLTSRFWIQIGSQHGDSVPGRRPVRRKAMQEYFGAAERWPEMLTDDQYSQNPPRLAAAVPLGRQLLPSYSAFPMLSSRAAHSMSKRKSTSANRDQRPQVEASTLIEHCPYAVAMIGAGGRFAYVNPAHVALFGWSNAEMMRKQFLDIFPPNRRDEVRAAEQILRGAGTFLGVFHAWRKNNRTLFPVEVALRMLPPATTNDDECGVFAILQDVSDRNAAEKELINSQQRLELAMRGSNDGLWDWNIEQGEVFYSSRWKSMLGYEEDEIVADISEWRSRIHADDLAAFDRRIADHLANRNSLLEIEHRLLHRDGVYRSMLARGVSIRDSKNQPYRMAGSLTDLTARKQSEEESRRRQAELAHVLRLTSMGEMASGLAHELNQPLAAISNYLHGCIRRLRNGAAPDAAFVSALEDAAQQSLRLGDIIRRLRTYVRKEAPQREPVRLNDLCRDVYGLLLPEARMHDIHLSLDLKDVPVFAGDPVQIEQVVMNLVRNALDSLLDPKLGRREIAIQTSHGNDGFVELLIRSSGPPIPVADVNRIWEPFFTTKLAGLGMGLSISRSIIEAHGGSLGLIQNDSAAVAFGFRLPR